MNQFKIALSLIVFNFLSWKLIPILQIEKCEPEMVFFVAILMVFNSLIWMYFIDKSRKKRYTIMQNRYFKKRKEREKD